MKRWFLQSIRLVAHILWRLVAIACSFSDFAFFRLVHYRRGDYGTFALLLPTAVVAVGEFLFGKTVIQTTIHHDIHHQNPRIAAHALASAKAHIEAVLTA